jgi:hypothetical protein
MRPRVQWALFCRELRTDDRGLTTVSDLVHVLSVEPTDARLWLVASIEGEPERRLPVTLLLRLSGRPPMTLPSQELTLGPDGFAELKVQLPPFSRAEPGTVSVDLSFAEGAPPAERVAVKIVALRT